MQHPLIAILQERLSVNWDDLKIFLAVAREGSARAAAHKLRINHSTVTRRIEAFESSQKVRLFDRLSTGYTLTAAGEELLQAAVQVEEEIHGIERHILGKDIQLRGDIRVTMPDVFAVHLLMPDLANFMNLYPEVNLKVLTSYNLLNLNRREADVAIRITENPPEYLVGRKVVRYHCASYATPAYLAAHHPSNLTSKACWLGWEATELYPDWVRKSQFPHLPIRGRFNHPMTQVAAAKAGLGITNIPCFLGDREPELQRVPPGNSEACRDVWILAHKDLVSTVRIRTFMDAMAEAFRQKRAVLEGRGKQEKLQP